MVKKQKKKPRENYAKNAKSKIMFIYWKLSLNRKDIDLIIGTPKKATTD